MNRKRTILIVSSCVSIVGVLALGLVMNLLWSVSGISLYGQLTEHFHMEDYLEEKYGQDFVIDSVERGSQLGIGASVTMVGKAHLKNESSVAFEISRESRQDYSTYRDTLLSSIWSRQATESARSFLQNDFDNIEKFKISVRPSEKLRQSIKGGLPSLVDVKKDGIDDYSYSLTVYSSTSGQGKQPSNLEIFRMKTLIEFVKQQATGQSSIVYYYGPASDRYPNRDHMYNFSISGEKLKTATIDSIKDGFRKT